MRTTAVRNHRWQLARMRAHVLAAQAMERDEPVGPAWLAGATAWVAEVAPDWETLTGRAPGKRSWLPLVNQPDLQGWLICWPAGHARALHHHDGAAGALQVLRGTLNERFAEPAGALLAHRRLEAGVCTAFGPDFVHAIGNAGPGLVTSVHFYGRAVPVAGRVPAVARRAAQAATSAAAAAA